MNYREPDLLKGLNDEQMEQALALGSRISLPGGAELFGLGSEADRLFLIDRGRVKLTLPIQLRGHDQDILVEERSSGQTVGWSALIPPYRFTLKATTLIETDLIALSRESLRALFAASPEVGYTVSLNLAAVIGQRLQLFQTMWLREMQRVVERHCV
ncbi:MAG TPA: cyclic nucleotide-binding domain-containing protein [Bryobacteraceae bacterium]|nr:cyclic nucleotide-binding domain-containing protein [Bryobacteraceae bacterium]